MEIDGATMPPFLAAAESTTFVGQIVQQNPSQPTLKLLCGTSRERREISTGFQAGLLHQV
jgi:hypothetical protein